MIESVQTMLNAVTTTTTGDSVAVRRNVKSYQATLSDSVSPTATVVVEVSNDKVAWITLATLTLSGALDTDGTTTSTAWVHTRGRVTAITGTLATVTLTVAA